eukprot:scaffold190558_cov28-Attheya_sp.AAC.1
MATEVAAAASTWVQLYYTGEAKPVREAEPIEIKPIPNNVNDLKKKVHEENSTKLNHIDAGDLKVYASGTAVPVRKGLAFLAANVSGSEAATGASFDRPLIVVAPKPVQQQQNAVRNPCRCCIMVISYVVLCCVGLILVLGVAGGALLQLIT